MALVLYPETQKRAQDEIDGVVGRGRLPTFEDCERMPYMQAMVCAFFSISRIPPNVLGSRSKKPSDGGPLTRWDFHIQLLRYSFPDVSCWKILTQYLVQRIFGTKVS